MFTGIVESVGTVVSVSDTGAPFRLTLESPGFGDDLQHGESIAVNGVCLTVAHHEENTWVADVMKITRETTTLGALEPGQKVNLERAMRADGRLGGHMVQGHVDGTATLVERDSQEEWENFVFELPDSVLRYVALKGSLTVDGVSLTVAALEGARATVSLIPTTMSETTLGALTVGDSVNIEVDIIAKYVERMLGGHE